MLCRSGSHHEAKITHLPQTSVRRGYKIQKLSPRVKGDVFCWPFRHSNLSENGSIWVALPFSQMICNSIACKLVPFHKEIIKYTTDLVPHPFPGPTLPPFFSCFLHTIGGKSSAEL